MNKHITKLDAVLSLVGGQVSTSDYETFDYFSGQTPPTVKEIQTEYNRLQEAYDDQAYARKRAEEYPSIQELVVALYDTDDKSAVEAKRAAIKAKYPKPE